MSRDTDAVRLAGERALAGKPFSDSTLSALYAVPTGTVLRRLALRREDTESVDRMLAIGRRLELELGPSGVLLLVSKAKHDEATEGHAIMGFDGRNLAYRDTVKVGPPDHNESGEAAEPAGCGAQPRHLPGVVVGGGPVGVVCIHEPGGGHAGGVDAWGPVGVAGPPIQDRHEPIIG